MLPNHVRRALFAISLLSSLPAQPVPYDIVYVRAPRWGDDRNTRWAEVFHPTYAEPGSDLMLLHPDGKEEVLFPAGPGAVADPVMSFDAAWVYFSYYPDVRPAALNTQRGDAPKAGADIYKLHLATRRVVRLTTQQWTPPSGASRWSSDHLTAKPDGSFYLDYGIFNLAPCPLPGGKLMFVSSRDGYLPNKSFTFPNLRLYVMDTDGRNVEPVGHLNIGSALHPTVLADGRVMFASYEAQGIRDERLWGLWSIYPDGRHWEPLMSAFTPAAAMHFQTQLSDGRIAVVGYYNLHNNGLGTLPAFQGKPEGTRGPGDGRRLALRRRRIRILRIVTLSIRRARQARSRKQSSPSDRPRPARLDGCRHREDLHPPAILVLKAGSRARGLPPFPVPADAAPTPRPSPAPFFHIRICSRACAVPQKRRLNASLGARQPRGENLFLTEQTQLPPRAARPHIQVKG